MLGIFQDFRCDIARCTTKRGGERFLANDFGQTEICQFDMQVLISQEDILWFNVSMDDISIVLGLSV